LPTHYKGSAKAVRALNAHINLERAANTVAAQLTAQLDPQGLTISQFGTLEVLYHLGPLCQNEIAQKLLRSGGNMTLVINNLEKQGWVRRVRQGDDRRLIRVHLTPKGRREIARVIPGHVNAIIKTMSPLTVRDQEDLRRICRKFGRGSTTNSRNTFSERGNKHDSNSTK
jgi:MarR family transcriptional regulator, 2-MHQ and catechol-resistance regulon repressor